MKLDAEMGFNAFWSPSSGLRFEGSAAIELDLPAHIQLGPLEIVNVYLRAGLGSDGSIPIELSGAFNVMLGPLQAAVDRIGLKATITFPDGGGGNLGPANLKFDFKPPNGVGLSIDTGVIEGGGYLYFDFDKEEYAGAIELMVADWLHLTAIGLVTTRMPDGSKGFSLLIIITAEFGTGIQLGMGFVLVGVGGLLGVNRTVKLELLANGVRTGTINNIIFPHDVVANAPRIISDLRAIFPPQEGVFLIGPMAKLGWGSPPLVTLSLGVIIEIPPGNIAILGVLRCILPDEDADILKLQIAFVGAIEWDKKRLWFFAGLFDSHVLTFTIEGEMGLLFAWGDDATFVLSVGGFHPRFKPPPLPFPSPKRLAISILDEDWGRIRVSAYFAITSNTVQFGCAAELHFDFSAIAIDGGFHFDALFQFSPFYFIIELGANVSLSLFGMGIFSISLELSLEGPTPWHAKGTGSISFFFFSVSADFDQTWGESADTTLPPVDVVPILAAELAKDVNWSALPPPSGKLLVSLRVAAGARPEFVLHPVGTLRVSQRALPLNSNFELFGTQKPDDATRFDLTVSTPGLAVAAPVPEQFAPAQFHKLSNDQKLTAPSFEPEQGGIDIRPNTDLNSSLTARRTVRYEQIIIDTNFRQFQQSFANYPGGLFNHFLRGNAAARSPLSAAAARLRQPFDDTIAAASESFGVASTENNTLMQGTQLFGSYQAAKQHMDAAVAANPSLAGSLHVLPKFEIQGTA